MTLILIDRIDFPSPIKKNEKYLAEYLSDKSFKRSYVKSLPKKLRPDLKNYHDFLMTRDPSTNSVPSERVLDAIKLRDAKLNSRSYLLNNFCRKFCSESASESRRFDRWSIGCAG